MKLLIKNARVIDPASSLDAVRDVLISGGKIEKISTSIKNRPDEIIDAVGKIALPGLIDMHAHLREPGREDEETVRTGTFSAVRGGYTTVCCMPNTDPAIDTKERVKNLANIIKKDAVCNVHIIGAITKGRWGREVADFKGMLKEGAVAFSDDGSSIDNPDAFSEALKKAKENKTLLIEHCEDTKLSKGGVVNKGLISTKMGLRGISRESEYERIQRDLELAKETGARIHIAHVTCKESVDLIRKAKKDGVLVTAECAPHHLALTEDCCATYDTNTKMNPPLRSKDDQEALKKGLVDGTIEIIATDHAPHTDSEKDVEFDFAPFGIIGLETALSLCIMELIEPKILTWTKLIEKLSVNPAKILGLEGGIIKEGAIADITIVDPDLAWTYRKEGIVSKSKNSPFIGWNFKGAATDVIIGGKVVMRDRHV